MRIIFCGGGTSGHVSPALGIADAFRKASADCSFLFIGRIGGKENDAVKKAGIDLKEISIEGLNRSHPLKNVKILANALDARKNAIKIISDFAPDAVVGTGGYVCWPIISAAEKMNIPCFIHESNSSAGLTTRLLAKKCHKVFVGMHGPIEKLKNAVYTGNPIYSDFMKLNRISARRRLGIDSGTKMIISVGGSIGAEKLNETAIKVLKKFSLKRKDVIHIHICGYRYYDIIKQKTPELCDKSSGSRIIAFSSDMPTLLHAADAVITRCGALTLSEIAYCRVPAILIPSPNVTGDHQRKNAYAHSMITHDTVIEENSLSAEMIISELENIFKVRHAPQNVPSTVHSGNPPHPAETIMKIIIDELNTLKKSEK